MQLCRRAGVPYEHQFVSHGSDCRYITEGAGVTEYQFLALLLAGIGPLLALARMLRAPESLVLFGVGLGSAFLPGLPPVRVDPQLLLNLFLPPLVYASTVRVSWLLLRFTLLPGGHPGRSAGAGHHRRGRRGGASRLPARPLVDGQPFAGRRGRRLR